MNKDVIIRENPLLADRIQLSISSRFIIYKEELEKGISDYISSVFKAYLSDKKECDCSPS